ncbi:DUF3005 domain-containing protein [Paraburkholderia lacunae]|uniref:DUF3005 domain-containing protein n=1 Tax=Paraburkholderia lacunae TaxID=2211104 RepID=A0A370NC88_9BURK|nr:DUF3005 domain-containing protein [Paraburkholderia lacunae]RDK03219.1 hypothetical protein DLM46_08555 [Paraburkholderia lacunae]
MNSTEISKQANAARLPGAARPSTAELHNDRTHDSTVDTDGKNREAARIANHSPIAVDEIICSNATLCNSMPESPDGMAGFDSRVGGHHPLLALEPGYLVIDKGMVEPQTAYSRGPQIDDPRPLGSRRESGRTHYAVNHLRPTRVIELLRSK